MCKCAISQSLITSQERLLHEGILAMFIGVVYKNRLIYIHIYVDILIAKLICIYVYYEFVYVYI